MMPLDIVKDTGSGFGSPVVSQIHAFAFERPKEALGAQG
jgi:hypothetical protein